MATKRRKKPEPDMQLRLGYIEISKRHTDLMVEHVKIQSQYSLLCRKLTSLLTPDQVDAAKTCGVAPEIYAIEWIEINKNDLLSKAPGFASYVRNLAEMKS